MHDSHKATKNLKVFFKNHLLWCSIYVVISILCFAISCNGVIPAVRCGDSFTQNYFLRLYYAKEGLKLWLPYEFLGLPFLGLLHVGLLYPFNLGYFFISPIWMFTLNEILHPALASSFTFIYARYNGISTLPSFMAGIIFGFSGFMAAHKVHTSMINAATWFPLLLYLYERIRRELQLKHSAVASVIVALQVFAGHYQVSVYTYLTLGLFSIVARGCFKI